MAKPKKGALAQLLVPLVDSVDFASIESGITESDFNSGATRKFYGVNHGGSAATTSGTISKLASLVHSGVFRLTLKGTENNYDLMQVRITKTGCAEQILEWENVDYDDSDVYSAILLTQSAASDAASAATQGNSRVLLNLSRISDIASMLTVMSGIQSDIYSAVIAGVLVNASGVSDIESRLASQLSDILSAAVQTNSRALVIQSLVSDVDSALTSRFSDLHSFLSTTGVALHASALSDVGSRVWVNSARTLTSGVAATVSASDISDIASAVWANAIGTRVDSRVLLAQSMISDVQSALAAGVALRASDISDLRSAIAAGPAATVTASDISDIASAVWAHATGNRVDSRILVNQSRISDIYSALSDALSGAMTASDLSDIASAVWAHATGAAVNSRVLLNLSRISDVHSLVTANGAAAITASDISDIASAVWANTIGARVDSRLLVAQSTLSDIRSQITAGVPIGASDMSDLRSAITAGGISASGISDIASAVDAVFASRLSDILSAAQQVNSRALVLESMVSDVDSALSSQFTALTAGAGVTIGASSISDLRSAITATALSASDLSDIASAVWARAGADPTTVVAAAGTMGAKLDWLTALSRNEIQQTATAQSLRNDDNNADIASAAVADDGTTFTRAEWS